MKISVQALIQGFGSELTQLIRSPLLIILTAVQAVTFIFLVNFFGMTGAYAPTALVDNDHGYYAKAFIENLRNAHHAFRLSLMNEKSAAEAVKKGKIVAVITLPRGFSEAIDNRETTPLNVTVDNIDTDMTADIQRALPSAIASFAKEFKLPGIKVQANEIDIIDHDTDFIPYLVTSALALSSLLGAGILAAVTVAREFETQTIRLSLVSPVNPVLPLLGRVLATNVISIFTLILAVGIVILGHQVVPVHPVQLTLALLTCIIIFGFIGAALGAATQKTLPVVSLIFGISFPLYLFSGTYEPERFDGNLIWTIAHFTPLYYAVGILEHAALDLKVTPEPVYLNFIALFLWALLAVTSLWYFVKRETT